MMASSGRETLDIRAVHQCNRCLRRKTLHPQASTIRLGHTNVGQHSIKFDFYTVLLMESNIENCCYCGRKAYNCSNATVVFLPPGQTFSIHKNRVLPQQGQLLAFHPDLLYGTILGENIQGYAFFFYRKEETLHLSQREKDKIIECLREMGEESHHPIDRHSQTLIPRYIELLLDYCTRFYERQFVTRENKNKVLLNKADHLLGDYIYSGKLKWGDPPASAYCAENLKLPVTYFEDLLTFKAGKTSLEFFQLKKMETAKRTLLDKEDTIKAIASQLGFSSMQLSYLFFKKIMGVAPNEYRHSQN